MKINWSRKPSVRLSATGVLCGLFNVFFVVAYHMAEGCINEAVERCPAVFVLSTNDCAVV